MKNILLILGKWGKTGLPLASIVLGARPARAQSFAIDFGRPAGPPLSKTKFGVYQTPLVTLPRLLDSVALLREAGVRDFRYEIGWGKPDVLAWDQIGGTVGSLKFDFSALDALMERLDAANVQALLALAYCPNPLKARAEWAAWKDRPTDLAAWQEINRAYAAHLRARFAGQNSRHPSPFFEVWNEPDMPEPGGKMFFSGTAQDYGQLFERAAAGLRAGDGEARVGGPAAAYDLSYLTPIINGPLDFASIHGYANYGGQIAAMRAALSAAKRPDVPIFVTEYASFSDLPANGPQSRAPGAMRFLRDTRAMLDDRDVAKVYWAQWLDAGEAPGMGFITWDGHRKAIFNALKIYNWLPIDRVALSPQSAQNVGGMAGAEAHRAGLVMWNESEDERAVTLDFSHWRFARGRARLFRIDAHHASYVDEPKSENLQVLESHELKSSGNRAWRWSGKIPAGGVIFWQFDEDAPQKSVAIASPNAKPVGIVVGQHYAFADRAARDFADFDALTTTARLNLDSDSPGGAQIGVTLKNPAARWRVRIESEGVTKIDRDSLLGLRLDFPDDQGIFQRSVLFHNGFYNAKSEFKLLWEPKNAVSERAISRRALRDGGVFDLDLQRLAPRDWSGKRVLVSLILRHAGRGARAKFVLSAR